MIDFWKEIEKRHLGYASPSNKYSLVVRARWNTKCSFFSMYLIDVLYISVFIYSSERGTDLGITIISSLLIPWKTNNKFYLKRFPEGFPVSFKKKFLNDCKDAYMTKPKGLVVFREFCYNKMFRMVNPKLSKLSIDIHVAILHKNVKRKRCVM